MGGIFSILDQFEIANIYDNGFSNFGSELYGDYVAAVRGDLTRYHILQAGQTVQSGDLTLEVLNPLLPPTGKINEDSIMLKASYGNVRILLSGDVGQVGERRLLAQGQNMNSQIIKVGHHGENDVMSDVFLRHVNPESAIISVSRINKYGRPHPRLMEKLKKAGVTVYRTDRDGHVRLSTDGSHYSIDVFK
jgi:beta-lactamase superfamily II metal-dependent hydrolase